MISVAIATLDWSLHIPEYNCIVNSLDLSLLSDLSPLTDLMERKKREEGDMYVSYMQHFSL